MTVNSLMCFGYGYTAKHLAKHVSLSKWNILGTNRTPETNISFDNNNVSIIPWSIDDDFPLQGAKRAIAVLISVPPNENGCPVFNQMSLSKFRFEPETWVGYLSSTGVYGDLRGGWAFEETPVKPLSMEAKNRAIAETQWQELGAHIFRLPGIYGVGRSNFDRLRSGNARRIIREGQIFSRAHVDDIADILVRSIAKPNSGRIYNIADDVPCPPQDIIAYGASLLGLELPPAIAFEEAGLPLKARRFYTECKRISNARAKAELGWRPKYPSYREGLQAVLDAEIAASS